MLRFLRKYNKYILAVFGTLLLITFLVPYAITQIGQASASRGVKWATVGVDGSETLKSDVLAQARRELQFLSQNQIQVVPFGIMNQPVHWYLLSREAEQAGFLGSFPAGTFGLQQSGNQDSVLATNTMAKLLAINSMMQLHQDESPAFLSNNNIGRLSDRRVKHIAKDRFHNVSVQMVMIKATAPDTAGTFTDAQLQEQFDKYAELLPGEGDMGFGYRLPNRLKLEWIEVTAESVKQMIESSDALNAVDLRKHWRQNDARLGPPIADAEVPQEVYDDLLENLLDAKLKEISRFGYNLLRRSQRSLTSQGGAFVLSDDWQGLSFVDIAQNMQTKFGVSLPNYHAAGSSWLWTEEVADLKGIGKATTLRFGQFPLTLRDIVSALREFNTNSAIPVQSRVAGPPLSGSDGSIYFYRVTDVDASRPPVSLFEVKDAVVADLGRIGDYDRLVLSKDEIEQQARENGLLAVAMSHDTVIDRLRSISTSFPADLPEIGANEDVIKAIVERAKTLPVDVAFDKLSDEQKTFVMPVDDSLVLLVVKLVSQSPLTDSFYQIYSSAGILQNTTLERNSDLPTPAEQITEAFGLDALIARQNFEYEVEPVLIDDDELLNATSKPAKGSDG